MATAAQLRRAHTLRDVYDLLLREPDLGGSIAMTDVVRAAKGMPQKMFSYTVRAVLPHVRENLWHKYVAAVVERLPDADANALEETLRTCALQTADVVSATVEHMLQRGYKRGPMAKRTAKLSDDADRDYEDEPLFVDNEETRELHRACLRLANPSVPADTLHRAYGDEGWSFTKTLRRFTAGQDLTAAVTEDVEWPKWVAKRQAEIAHAAACEVAVKSGLVQDCPICADGNVAEPDMLPCSAGHWTCCSCVRSYITGRLYDDGVATRQCMFPKCDGEYTEAALQTLLPRRARNIFARLQSTAALLAAGIDEQVHQCACGNQVIVPPGNSVHECILCLRSTCVLCNLPAHVPLRCSQVETDKQLAARKRAEEAMTEALVRVCECGTRYLKREGCNHITCSNCRRHLCYLCRAVITNGYGHFCNTCPYRQRAQNCLQCHVYDDPTAADNALIERAREEAVREAHAQGLDVSTAPSKS